MDSEDIKKIIKDYAEKGYSIKVRDIMYALLRTKIDDDVIIYQSLYGIDSDINVINKYVEREDVKLLIKGFKDISANDALSYDENRKGMEEDLRNISKYLQDREEELEPNQYATLMAKKTDLRVKLNDKFGADEKKDEQRIIVNTHYNHICEILHKECLLYEDKFKERFMKKWNLIEKPKK